MFWVCFGLSKLKCRHKNVKVVIEFEEGKKAWQTKISLMGSEFILI